MSDALTDTVRDGRTARLRSVITEVEREFLKDPSPEKASRLVEMWQQYHEIPRGYWSAPNREKARERISLYREYLETGEFDPAPVLADLCAEGVVMVGNGFIVNDEEIAALVSRTVSRALREASPGGPVNHSVFRLKVFVEAERVTCAACPFFGCGCCSDCNSRVGEEFAVRRERVAKGVSLL